MAFDASIDDVNQDLINLQKTRDIVAAGWCRNQLKDLSGNHCLLGAFQEATMGKIGYDYVQIGAIWRTLYHGEDHFGELLGFHNADPCEIVNAVAIWNNSQPSVEPVLERLDRAIERLATPQSQSQLMFA